MSETPPTIDPTKIVQIEIACTDLERSLAFYNDVFGWQAVPTDIDRYTLLEVPDHCHFGISLRPRDERETFSGLSPLTLYLAVADYAPYLERVRKSTGRVVVPKMKWPGYGEACIVADPDGQRFGLHARV